MVFRRSGTFAATEDGEGGQQRDGSSRESHASKLSERLSTGQ